MKLDSYTDMGSLVAVDLVNRFAVDTPLSPAAPVSTELLSQVVAEDPGSVRALEAQHHGAFATLASELHEVLILLAHDDEDAAGSRLNKLLQHSPTRPHLAKEGGRWRLHHHPAETDVVPMWRATCAEALARLLSHGDTHRVRACADPRCSRLFIDTTRSATRRFCTTRCQNRIKTASLRAGQRDH